MPNQPSPIDAAWRTRIPQGWIQFADGSIGPPNQPSPIDAAWRTRIPSVIPFQGAQTPVTGALAGPGPGGEMPGGGLLGRMPTTPGAPSMGFPAQTGPEIFSPPGSNVGTGKEVGAWTNPFTDAKTIDPAEFKSPGFNPLSLFSKANPYIAALTAAAGVMAPTSTAADDQPSTDMWWGRPSGVGGMPGPGASSSTSPAATPVAAPDLGGGYGGGSTVSTASRPGAAPVAHAPRPTASAKAPAKAKRRRIDPDQVNLANPRFTTVQYGVPSGRGPLGNNPIYTALNLADLFGGKK